MKKNDSIQAKLGNVSKETEIGGKINKGNFRHQKH